MSSKLIDTLGRMDLDRKLLLKEKIDVLLESQRTIKKGETNKLVELKHGRRKAIYLQCEAYNQILKIVASRQQKSDLDEHAVIGVSPEEIKFMNMLRVLLDAGWCLDEASLV